MAKQLCDAETTRRGEVQPCEKPAVAMKRDPEGNYPVCAFHARGDMVPLDELLAKVEWGVDYDGDGHVFHCENEADARREAGRDGVVMRRASGRWEAAHRG